MRHSVAHIWTNVDIIDVQNRNIGKAGIDQLFERSTGDFTLFIVFQRQFIASLDVVCAILFVNNIARDKFSNDLLKWQQKLCHLASINQFFNRPRGHFFTGFADNLTRSRIHQIIEGARTTHALREEFCNPPFTLGKFVINRIIIGIHNTFLIQA